MNEKLEPSIRADRSGTEQNQVEKNEVDQSGARRSERSGAKREAQRDNIRAIREKWS